MAITKTNFINYSRCPRYLALENIKKDRLDAEVTYQDYLNEEISEKLQELIFSMYETDEEGNETDLIDTVNPQLESMMKYYKQVENLAGKLSTKYFKGKSIYASETKNQECFDFSRNGLRYLCYVDIYNENNDYINIIEVKATTSKKYAELVYGKRGGEKHPIFTKINNIYKFNYCLEDEKSYTEKINKLKDRFSDVGKYVYDLSVQRYIIENELKQSGNNIKLKRMNYYLAVLNHEYVYDGVSDYEKDESGNEIITFIDLNDITKQMQEIIEYDAQKIEKNIFNSDAKEYPLGKYCEYKKQTECKYFKKICGAKIPLTNSSLNYMDNQYGFKDEFGDRLKGLELINEGYIDILDIPESWITRENHFIQRNAYRDNKPYIDIEKIKLGLAQIQYPIYHLDFETFPCPIPRFKGDRVYEQAPFEFSLHIEHSPGVCDKEKDNIVFLAETMDDEREKLIKTLLENIDVNKGTLLAQNVSFEKRCLKRLGEAFPEYNSQLMKLHDRDFDLIWLLKTNSKLYQDLNYSEEESKIVNYYHKDFSGSYSIKKTLPVFSDLSYKDLDVKNGTEAIVVYANYPLMSKEELKLKYEALIEYCKQDTWAMVVILDGLRKLVK